MVFTSAKTIFTVFHLRGGQAAVGFFALAQQRCRIEVALGGIADQAVLHAVQRIALGQDRFVQRLNIGLRKSAVRILHQLDGSLHARGVQMDVRIGGRAGQHAVEIVGEFGYFHQRLPAARGASVPIRIFGVLPVIGLDQRLRLHDGVVHRAPSEVDDLLRMAQREHPVAALVARVGGCGGVSFAQRRGHLREADDAGPSAVAHHFELAVPIFDGQPQLHLDVGIG